MPLNHIVEEAQPDDVIKTTTTQTNDGGKRRGNSDGNMTLLFHPAVSIQLNENDYNDYSK